MDPHHLRVNEIDYEISVRGIVPLGDIDSKRKILRGLLSQEKANRSFVSPTSSYGFETDHAETQTTLDDLKARINEFTGPSTSVAYKRISSRLAHVSGRIHRMVTDSPAQGELKDKLHLQLLSLEGDLEEKIRPISSTPNHSENFDSNPLEVSNVFTRKPVFPYKWNLHFTGDGSGESLISFLEKVETLRISRGVSTEDLFLSAGDLFKSQAWIWFNTNRSKLHSWEELITKLKDDFLPYHYDDDRLEEINHRTQGSEEKVCLYICSMESLFNRLSKKPDEITIVNKIRRNLLPRYVHQLALHDIRTVADLSSLCKKLEESHSWTERYQPPNFQKTKLLEPDLAYHPAKPIKPIKQISALSCWNCHKSGHIYNQCRAPRQIFCYGCGTRNTTKKSCTSCSKKLANKRCGTGLRRFDFKRSRTAFQKGQTYFSDKGYISQKVEWQKWLKIVSQRFKTTSQKLSPPTVCPLFTTKPNDNRPHLKIKILGEDFLALIDCGSCSTIMGSTGFQLMRRLKLPLMCDDAIQITTADGSSQNCLGSANIPVSLEGTTKLIKFLVVPSISHDLILGVDFLQTFGLTVDFSNLSFSKTSSTCAINTICPYESLSSAQKDSLSLVIEMFREIGPEDRLGRTTLISHHIDTGDAKPFKQRQYPLSPAMQQHLNVEVDKMLKLRIIQPSQSPWCSPLWLVKKSSGEYRVCFDGRKLNTLTVRDAYPLPLIDTILNKVRDAKFVSSIDLKQAFFQIPLDETSRPKTAFAIHGRGLFEFRSMPFGLSCSSQTMCRLMDLVIGPSLEPYVFYYLDDIIVCTPDFNTHIDVLSKLHTKLKEANLTVNFKKCHFCRPSLNFLGFIVDNNGLRTCYTVIC